MPDPFQVSRQKLTRAEKHFAELQRQITAFHMLQPYDRVVEPHPDKLGHTLDKFRMTQELPQVINDEIAETAVSLRSALDNAGFALAVAAGVIDPKHCAFPFAASAAHMVSGLGRCKECEETGWSHPYEIGL